MSRWNLVIREAHLSLRKDAPRGVFFVRFALKEQLKYTPSK